MKFLIAAPALLLFGCGTTRGVSTLEWQNNAQYSAIEIERAEWVRNACQNWGLLAKLPGNTSTVRALEPKGGPWCYRLRGCNASGCSDFTEHTWKGASR
jgi:hypothetical protein